MRVLALSCPSFYLSVFSQITARLRLKGFTRHLILETVIKICGESTNNFKIGQKYKTLYMKI